MSNFEISYLISRQVEIMEQQVVIINEQRFRIAELEAEVTLLKDQTKAKWKDAYSRICPDITQEGEG